MALTDARKRANAKYNLKAYDRVELKVKKGKKEIIKQYAEEHGESLNAFINRAISEAMGEIPRAEAAEKTQVRKKKEMSVELL